MTILKHELRQGKISFIIWTGSIVFLLALCVALFDQMKSEMGEVDEMFSSLGAFTDAFGMDRLNFGTLIGYYAIECGNILGLGGAFYAALCAVTIISKEEKDKTAEFLLAHPVSRSQIVTGKLLAVLIQITLMNLITYAVAAATMNLIGEDVPCKELSLLHLAYFFMQIEIAGICFGISAFMRKKGVGVGLGIAAVMYFLNLIANISESVEFLKYVTPFGYCDGADIIADGSLDKTLLAIGAAVTLIGVAAAYIKYQKKDIH